MEIFPQAIYEKYLENRGESAIFVTGMLAGIHVKLIIRMVIGITISPEAVKSSVRIVTR
jgi:hypothetical protein